MFELVNSILLSVTYPWRIGISPAQKAIDIRELNTDISSRTFGTNNRDSIRQQTCDFNEGKPSTLFNTNAPQPVLSQLQLKKFDVEKIMLNLLAKPQAGLATASKQPRQNAIQSVQLTGDLKMENTINVNLTSA